jgi:hypothetical protein
MGASTSHNPIGLHVLLKEGIVCSHSWGLAFTYLFKSRLHLQPFAISSIPSGCTFLQIHSQLFCQFVANVPASLLPRKCPHALVSFWTDNWQRRIVIAAESGASHAPAAARHFTDWSIKRLWTSGRQFCPFFRACACALHLRFLLLQKCSNLGSPSGG